MVTTDQPRTRRTQRHRPIAIATPLGDDKVLIRSFTASEQLARPFRIDLELISDDGSIDPLQILGQRATIRVAQAGGGTRYFNGHVSRWRQAAPSGGMARYQATLVPWLWLLTRAADCRVFQEMSVPDIVQKIFRDHGFSHFQLSLNGTYEPLEYCVQYRETDFNFVSRLLEHAGIYYYFKHEDAKHTLVLADSPAAHRAGEGYEEIRYQAPDRVSIGRELVSHWDVERRVQTGKFVHTDFDFQRPAANLETRSQASVAHAGSAFEIFDYPGEYAATGPGETLAKIRMEEMQTEHETAQGETDSRGLAVGMKFRLSGFPREDQNRPWLVTATSIHVESDAYEGGPEGSAAPIYRCSFSVIDAATQYRPMRTTPKPLISGPQTAIVTGPKGEEIWTDKHGRVKVMFHWDRASKGDEKSSCWMRVAQAWAGKRFGAMFLPRVGHEVVVEFLEGDPDRPIVTGCVYNGREAPAYALPGAMTRSGVKTNSSKGGGGFNELRFEDMKGSEQVFIHAQKDMHVRVKHDLRETVVNDRHEIVDNDAFSHVKHDLGEKVGNDMKLQVGQDLHIKVNGKTAMGVDGSLSLVVKGAVAQKCKADQSIDVTGQLSIKADTIVIDGTSNITLRVGNNFIAIDSTGITIKGAMVELKGDAAAKVEAPAVDVKGTAAATFDGGAVAVVKGGVVKIN